MRRNLAHFSARVLERFQAGPRAEGVRVRAAKDGQPAEIMVYDVIGDDIFGGVTVNSIVSALADADGGPVRLRINSPGGDVFAGLAIYNTVRSYAGEVEVVVDGLAASAASIVAMAGGKVSMAEESMLMIHNAWTFSVGDRNVMAKKAETLAKVDATLAGIYESFSGKPAAEWAATMDAETWYTAQEAVDAGLANDVIAAPRRPRPLARAEVSETETPAPEAPTGPDRAAVARARLRVAESF